MWNVTKEVRERFEKSNLLPIHETDEDWGITIEDAKEEGEDIIARLKEELEEVKEELLLILPSRFHSYIEDGTLNQPSLPIEVREDYLQWMKEKEKEFEEALDAAHTQTEEAKIFLPIEVQEVLEDSLHDATLERIEREDNRLHLFINTDSGFTTKSHIHFTFHDIQAEEATESIQVGQWFIYYELKKVDDGFAFRVLFDCPATEWTITMKSLDAEYYYRPVAFQKLRDEEKLEETSFAEYMANLNPDQRYWFITPHATSTIKELSEPLMLDNGEMKFKNNECLVSMDDKHYTYDLEEYDPKLFIYTDIYEDPYAHLIEPVPIDDLVSAATSNNLELQVRAWNTMYANSKELTEIINRVLDIIKVTEENEMMVSVYANHFYQEGILREDVYEKYRDLIE